MSDNKIFKSAEIKSVNEKDRTVTAVISKQMVDLDGDVVMVGGIDAGIWKKNPVVFVDHSRRTVDVVAKGVGRKYWVEGDEALIKYQFAEEEISPLAEQVFKLYKGGYVKTMSIGIISAFKDIQYAEDKGRKMPKDARRVIHKSRMFEATITPMPSNVGALMKAVTKAVGDGVITKDDAKCFGPYCDCEDTVEDHIDLKGITDTDIGVINVGELYKDIEEKDIKIAELELLLKENKNDEEIDWNDYIAELLSDKAKEKEEESDWVDEALEELTKDD